MSKEEDEKNVHVSVITTAGSYPAEGYSTVPADQKVQHELEKAAKHLKITDTTGWIARVDGRGIVIEETYKKNNLSGKVEIDYGPPHGGGGHA